MNAIGKEYRQLGGDFEVVHHTQFLEGLVAAGKLSAPVQHGSEAYHDPSYLGRQNGVYEEPRKLINILSNDVRELPRARENSFCCGAGGAQFWKEEEAGAERISDNRYREAERTLADRGATKTLAVGCPFCKSMLQSTPGKGESSVAVKDVAELLWESIAGGAHEQMPEAGVASVAAGPSQVVSEQVHASDGLLPSVAEPLPEMKAQSEPASSQRAKWTPVKSRSAPTATGEIAAQTPADVTPVVAASDPAPAIPAVSTVPQPSRKKWAPKAVTAMEQVPSPVQVQAAETIAVPAEDTNPSGAGRKKWTPRKPAS